MSAKSDQVKGHAKEVAGILSGDKDLEAEGKTDRQTGEAQEKIDQVKDKVVHALDQVKDKIDAVLDKAKDAVQRK
jgi:uncharacterized protein YjbJ (UPF0337 family)